MKLRVDQIAVIARGAFLHDIGKVSIPEAILLKPGNLTPDETAVVRQHCFHGYEILRRIPFVVEPAEIVYSHHENYDGSGYPRGLKGEEYPSGQGWWRWRIPWTRSPGNRPVAPSSTISGSGEGRNPACWSGRQFDPKVVQSFLAMPQNIWTDLSKAIDHQG